MPQLQDGHRSQILETAAKTAAEPMHGLRLIIKEDVLPLSHHPKFEARTEVPKRDLLAPETWHCNRPNINLKTTIDVPLLGKKREGRANMGDP